MKDSKTVIIYEILKSFYAETVSQGLKINFEIRKIIDSGFKCILDFSEIKTCGDYFLNSIKPIKFTNELLEDTLFFINANKEINKKIKEIL